MRVFHARRPGQTQPYILSTQTDKIPHDRVSAMLALLSWAYEKSLRGPLCAGKSGLASVAARRFSAGEPHHIIAYTHQY
jgi:hypothetical protein